MDKRLLDILCCPVSRLPVRLGNAAQIEVLNAAIASGALQTTAGVAITEPLRAVLVRSDGQVVYRIEDDIPVMLAEEAIGTTQLANFPV